jgi:hypothetical protein
MKLLATTISDGGGRTGSAADRRIAGVRELAFGGLTEPAAGVARPVATLP